MARAAPPVKIGDVVGKTRIERRIGSGSMGSVFLGHHAELDRTVALKVLNVDISKDAKAKERFLREGRMQATLDHENIVKVFALGSDKKRYYLAMEYVDGINLGDLAEREIFAPEKALKVIWDLAQALKYIHARGLIHRDVKPTNVMIRRPDSRAVLMDFGLVRPTTGSKLTSVGTIMGTANYMPPEQANPRGNFGPISPVSDIYSLGATLYRLITGKPPYAARNPIETIMQLLRDPLVSPREIRPELPRELEDICCWCLERRPENRVPSAERLLEILVEYSKGTYQPREKKPEPSLLPQDSRGPTLKKRRTGREREERTVPGSAASARAALKKNASRSSERNRKQEATFAKRRSSSRLSEKSVSKKKASHRRKPSPSSRGPRSCIAPSAAKVRDKSSALRDPDRSPEGALTVIWVLTGLAFMAIVVIIVFQILE